MKTEDLVNLIDLKDPFFKGLMSWATSRRHNMMEETIKGGSDERASDFLRGKAAFANEVLTFATLRDAINESRRVDAG